ncbi:hypothetical protein JHK82_050588 [Glycine max]|nr:hypothetical protein JHK82_050588 [Glycine max]KAG5094909.1 hypothetical protein JHK84_050497 [Glycine max]
METIHETDYEYNPYAKEFGINIDSKLVSVEARYVELASEVCHRRGKIPVASEVAEMLVQMGKSTACYIGVLDRCKLEQDGRDICKWKQDRSGCFSVKSTYEALHDFRMGDNANDLLLKDALSAIPIREGITLSEQGCANRNSNPRGNFAERDLAR